MEPRRLLLSVVGPLRFGGEAGGELAIGLVELLLAVGAARGGHFADVERRRMVLELDDLALLGARDLDRVAPHDRAALLRPLPAAHPLERRRRAVDDVVGAGAEVESELERDHRSTFVA